jgi:CubicO group peptidase (beta-lactamase class C family)
LTVLDGLTAGFSGVVKVDRGAETLFAQAYGFAHRAYGVPNTVDTRFAIASGTKGFTAVTVAGLIADGALSLDTAAREVLGEDLPLIDDRVTVEHLLTHTSGIGDYYDELSAMSDQPPAQQLATSAQYLAAVDGFPPNFPPGEGFRYCNGGFVVLGLIAERVAGIPFGELVRARVCEPAGMAATAFLRSDELPARTATGYLEDGRTNVFELPVLGHGDGGIYSTAADIHAFWQALFAGRLVPAAWVGRMTTPRVRVDDESSYGLGLWLPDDGTVMLQGGDPGVTFRSVHHPGSGLTHTVLANVSVRIRPLSDRLSQEFLTKP